MPTDHGPTAERICALLAAEPSTREVSMFGGLSFMVNDKMIVNVRRGGDLLVRIDPRRSPELVAEYGARPAEMGAGRAMGPGWLDVPAELTTGDEQLRFWISVALEFNDQATAAARPPSPSGSRQAERPTRIRRRR